MTGTEDVLDAEAFTGLLPGSALTLLGQLREYPGAWFTVAIAAAAGALPGRTVLRPLSALVAADSVRQEVTRYRLLDPAAREGERFAHAAARITCWFLYSGYDVLGATGYGLPLPLLKLPALEPGVTPDRVSGFAAAWMWVAEQRENAVAVLRASAQHSDQDAATWQLAVVLCALFALGNDQQFWPEAIEFGLAAARRAGSTQGEAFLLEYEGTLYSQRGWTARAARAQHQALGLRELSGDVAGQMRSANALGLGAVRARDYPAAARYFQTASRLANRAGDEGFGAVILNNQAYLLLETGQAARAEPMIRGARARLHRAGLGLDAARALQHLARVRLAAAELEHALDAAEQAVAEACALGPTSCVAGALGALADVLAAAGQRARALDVMREAGALYRDLGDQWRYARTLERAAQLCQDDGAPAQAALLRRRAEDLRILLHQDDTAEPNHDDGAVRAHR